MENLEQSLVSVIKIQDNIIEIFEDGKVNFKDLSEVFSVISNAKEVADSSKEALQELKKMSPTQRIALEEKIKQEFDLENDEIEEVVEDAIDLILSVHTLIQKRKARKAKRIEV